MIGPDTVIYDCKEHEYNEETGWLSCKKRTGKPIIIGDKCFIGMRCIILKGVTIGDNCVISAGTIITKDVPAGHLASGNPAVYTPLAPHNGGPKDIQSN
ncbi:MAG: acyltransferase [Akkermansia sp.]|nr:acyltransferase [Akkermansia sp.]